MKYAAPALMGSRRPLVYSVIGTFMGRRSYVREWPWRRLMARAALLVCVSDEVRDESLQRFGVSPRRVVVIPNGRDPAVFHPGSGPPGGAAPTLIFVGALTDQKQPGRFVEVVRRLRDEDRALRAVMVGTGPLAAVLAPAAAAHGVELLGHRSDVPELLRQSDVLLMTSRPPEGMPGVLIEAGLSGVPAVSTPVPGAATVLRDGHTGLVVPDSVAAITQAVGDLLDRPERRAAMGREARTRCASEFGLDLMAQRWRAVLEPVLAAQAETARRGGPAG